jgi:hypothetical protein
VLAFAIRRLRSGSIVRRDVDRRSWQLTSPAPLCPLSGKLALKS